MTSVEIQLTMGPMIPSVSKQANKSPFKLLTILCYCHSFLFYSYQPLSLSLFNQWSLEKQLFFLSIFPRVLSDLQFTNGSLNTFS